MAGNTPDHSIWLWAPQHISTREHIYFILKAICKQAIVKQTTPFMGFSVGYYLGLGNTIIPYYTFTLSKFFSFEMKYPHRKLEFKGPNGALEP